MENRNNGSGEKAAVNLVGIGASAGGIEALYELLGALPASSGMAFLLVQHRDPGHPSLLAEILSKYSPIPIVDARDGTEIKGDNFYIIPADASVAAVDGALRLHPYDSVQERRMPIDAMFRVLANSRGQNSIGVVLSGTGSDGAIGIQEIKGGGGITFAQEPNSARFPGMPRKAIETECVDFVLSARGIAEKISEIAKHPYLKREGYAPEVESAADDNSLKKIFRLLRSRAHIDFSQYKRSTIQRRLGRRMALRHIQELSEYEEVLREDRAEADALAQDFLIRVTEFFRHAEDFTGLTETAFPALLEDRSQKDPLRIWVPGCASGEEVYSIAILLTEFLGDGSTAMPIQIFGTDLSEVAVAQARAGEYLSNIEREVSSERLRRFFIKLDDHYQIAKPIRDLCIFARHNLIYDPPYSRLDLISCRNVLIYFDLNLQRQVIQSFHYALKPRGFLQVGPSESIGQNWENFQLADPRYRVYRKQLKAGAIEPRAVEAGTAPAERDEAAPAAVSTAPDLHRAQRETDRLVITRYAPATVLIDENLNTVYFQGDTGPYLELARGGASLKLQRMVRPGLQMDVFSAIEQARSRGVPIRRERVRIEEAGQVARANVEVVPLNMQDSAGVFFVLFFEKVATPGSRGLGERLARWWTEVLQTNQTDSAADKDQIQHLRRELEVPREYLRNALEEHEASQEELKSAHEEAMSSNEEFQSTNEELETAKEELQSANEELSTTNDELRNSNQRLNHANDALVISRDHLKAIFETLREPLLILDSELKVLQANTAFYATFKVSEEETLNKRIYELGNGQWDFPTLRHLLEGILPRDTPIRDFEVTHSFPTIGAKTMLLNGRRLTGNGDILLAIGDVSERKAAFEDLKYADRQKDQFLAVLSHELRNPLAPVANALKLLQIQGELNPVQQRSRNIIERQIGQLARLVNDLLELSRLTSGVVALQRQRIALETVVERGVETSRPMIEERQQQLSVSTPAEPVWLNADATRLEEVLVNLLTNAAKYTNPGGRVWLSAQREGDQAVIRVRDTGIGIEPELLPHIFEMFTQSQRGLARSNGGLGIGLSVAKNLVEMHGGALEARSEGHGQGSEFIVRLPIDNSDPPPATHRVNRSQRIGQTSEGKPMRVLIVDDNEDMTETAALLFSEWGHETGVAHTGPEALQVAADFEPEVILLDIGLPELDGHEVARRLRQDPRFKDTLVIAVSGYGSKTDQRRSREAGFDEHLVKPFDLEVLNRLLSEKVESKRRAK